MYFACLTNFMKRTQNAGYKQDIETETEYILRK